MRFLRYWRQRSFCGIPGYAAIPFLIDFAVNMLVYYGSQLFLGLVPIKMLDLPLDEIIPVGPPWVSVYFLSYLFWTVGFIWISRESRTIAYQLLGANLIGKILCLTCFILYPLTIPRPAVPGTDAWSWLLRYLYEIDHPNNLFPSMHCYVSWYICRMLRRCRQVPKWFVVFSWCFTVMIFYSTLATRQHYSIDVLGGILTVELSLWLARSVKPERLYARLDDRLFGADR